MLELKRRLARLLVEKSYREGDFVLASGRRSDYYFDCRVTALHAEGAWLIGTLFNDMLKELKIKGVGGMTMGADPLVSATTVISHEQGRPLHGLLVRKEAKGHGTGQFVEGLGNFSSGDSVAMLEDVVTTGGSLLKACDRVRAAGLSIAAVCAILCYLLCFNLVRERVDVPANNSKMDIGKMLKSVFTNRALLGIIAAALFLLLAMLTMQGMAGYVFPNFYGSAAAQSTASLLSSVLILLVCAPFASKLANRFGKKELATVSCIVATVLEVICFVLKPTNVWVYVGFFCAAFICLGFFNTIIWAMITDVIDDSEVRNGIREDGTIYAVYSFARKLGQAFSSGLTGGLLTMIGYSAATAFDPEVTMGIFNISCIAPAIGFVAVALSLFFIYPLTKQKVEENVAALAQRHNK